MSKFKVGDLVERIDNSSNYSSIKKGACYVVVDFEGFICHLRPVLVDKATTFDLEAVGRAFFKLDAEGFELVEPASNVPTLAEYVEQCRKELGNA